MASRRKRWLARAVIAAAVALVVHGAALWLFSAWVTELGDSLASTAQRPASSTPVVASVEDDRPMEIETIVNQLDRPELKTPEEERKEEEAKKEEEDKNPHGQVVDIAKPAIEERPDKANYVSEYDSKVDHETKGVNARDRAGAKEERPGGEGIVLPPPGGGGAAPGRPDARPGRPGPLAMRELEQRRAQSGESGEVEPPRDRDGEMARPGRRSEGSKAGEPQTAPGENGTGAIPGEGGREGKPGKPNLLATPDMLQRAIGKGSGSMDYLKDVDDGESTALNSKKWAHAPFFNRVKRAVADEWHPEVVYVRHDPGGNVYGVKDRVTVLRVHLKPDGHLAAWTVLQSSGVDFLDDEAIDAFRKAQPFPNPPKALVESDGQIHFNFAFIFELSGHTSFKVYKYQ
jgi:TonB family protein